MPVPNTNNFSLQDVVNEVVPAINSLVSCFANAINSLFDPTYAGNKDRLSNFRNYGAQNNWLISNATYINQADLFTSRPPTISRDFMGANLSNDGTKLLIVEHGNDDKVHLTEYSFASPWLLNSPTLTGSDNISVPNIFGSNVRNARASFSSDGRKIYFFSKEFSTPLNDFLYYTNTITLTSDCTANIVSNIKSQIIFFDNNTDEPTLISHLSTGLGKYYTTSLDVSGTPFFNNFHIANNTSTNLDDFPNNFTQTNPLNTSKDFLHCISTIGNNDDFIITGDSSARFRQYKLNNNTLTEIDTLTYMGGVGSYRVDLMTKDNNSKIYFVIYRLSTGNYDLDVSVFRYNSNY